MTAPEVEVTGGPVHPSMARQRSITLGIDGRESFATPLVPTPPAYGTL